MDSLGLECLTHLIKMIRFKIFVIFESLFLTFHARNQHENVESTTTNTNNNYMFLFRNQLTAVIIERKSHPSRQTKNDKCTSAFPSAWTAD